MSAGHTPGKWRYEPLLPNKDGVACMVFSDNGPTITCTGTTHFPEHIANAKLIAAAPDLLESLEVAMEYMDGNDMEWAKKARAAIAKARGTV